MVESKKVRKYHVGKTSSRTIRTASLVTITGLYERYCKNKQTEVLNIARNHPKNWKMPGTIFEYYTEA